MNRIAQYFTRTAEPPEAQASMLRELAHLAWLIEQQAGLCKSADEIAGMAMARDRTLELRSKITAPPGDDEMWLVASMAGEALADLLTEPRLNKGERLGINRAQIVVSRRILELMDDAEIGGDLGESIASVREAADIGEELDRLAAETSRALDEAFRRFSARESRPKEVRWWWAVRWVVAVGALVALAFAAMAVDRWAR